jgi:hypothetical protein
MGRTLVDHSGKSVGSIIQVKNDTKGQPMNVVVQLGKETNAPVRSVPAHTIQSGQWPHHDKHERGRVRKHLQRLRCNETLE